MSTTSTIQIAPLPTTEDVSLNLIQWMFANTGIPTDYNIGSNIRTYSEAVGSCLEIEGVEAQAMAFQAMVYSAFSAFGISPLTAIPAIGVVTFSTLASTPLPAGQSVFIPANTIVQTTNGIQFATTSAVTLVSGTTTVNADVVATNPGSTGNVAANTIVQIATGLGYPLSVTNNAITVGGANAETAQQTLTRFLAVANSVGLCTPISIASAVIGVSSGAEKVVYASVIEGWIQQVLNNVSPLTVAFNVAVDNGAGSASVALLSAVTTFLSSGAPAGYRPAGVPFSVSGVIPVDCSVIVTANAINPLFDTSLQTSISQAIVNYFGSLGFTTPAELTQLTAAVANASFGQLTSLSVTLFDVNGHSQTVINAGLGQRIILAAYSVSVN